MVRFPFDIDNGELDGLRPQECFVLGYELAQIDGLLKTGEQFQKPVHASNRNRIEAELKRQERHYKLHYMQDDVSESWMWLAVAPHDLGEQAE